MPPIFSIENNDDFKALNFLDSQIIEEVNIE